MQDVMLLLRTPRELLRSQGREREIVMLMPKRVKRRKQFRGSMAGKALRGNMQDVMLLLRTPRELLRSQTLHVQVSQLLPSIQI